MEPFQSDRGAFLWFAVGFIVIPSLLYFPVNSLLTGYYVSSGNLYALFLMTVLLVALGYRTLRLARETITGNHDWNTEKSSVFIIMRLIIVLEILGLIVQQIDNQSQAIISRNFIREPNEITIIDGIPSISSQELVEIVIIALSIPIAFRLLRAYFELFSTWLAAANSIYLKLFVSLKSVENSNAGEQQGGQEQELTQTQSLRGLAREAILRSEMRFYLASVCIVVTVLFAIAMFQAVFESSATRRANSLIDEIERSPIAFSTKYEDITLDLIAVTKEFKNSGTSRPAAESSDPKIIELDSSILFESRAYGTVSLSDFLKSTFDELNSATTDGGEIQAEADLFISRLTELRRELEGVSRTNWDIIVVRTAIILLALVVVGIFQRILVAAVQERRSWEVKSAALAALSLDHLERKDVSAFLEIVKSEPFIEAKSRLWGGKTTDIDMLISRLETLVNPKPPSK